MSLQANKTLGYINKNCMVIIIITSKSKKKLLFLILVVEQMFLFK